MEVSADITVLRDTHSRLQGACERLPGILNSLAASEARPLEEMNRRLEEEQASKNKAVSRAKSLESQINQLQSSQNEAEKRNLNWMIAEYNNEKAKIRDSDGKINALKQQISEIRNSFNNLSYYINNFQNGGINSLSTAKNGVASLIYALEDYLNSI